MTLQKQLLPISFNQGLDTKTDPKQVVPGKLLELENGVFISPGQIKKRNGLDVWTTAVEAADAVTSGSALSTYNDELLMFSGDNVYSRLQATETWMLKGRARSVITSTDTVLRNGYTQANPEVCYLNGIELYAWEDSRAGIRYSVIDSETRATIISDEEITSTGHSPRCSVLANSIAIFFQDSSALKYRLVNAATPTAIGSPITVANDLSTGSIEPVATWGDVNENVWVAQMSGSLLQATVYSYGGQVVLSGSTVDTISGTMVNITGCSVSGSQSTIYYEITGSMASSHFVNAVSVSTTANVSSSIVGTPTVFKRSVGLASKAWQNGNSHFVNVIHSSSLQGTYFTLDADSNVISKANSDIAGPLRNNGFLSSVVSTADGIYRWANVAKEPVISEDGLVTPYGVTSTELDFAAATTFQSTTLAKNLHVVGGVLGCFDGDAFAEHGFNLYPENITTAVTGTAGVGAGTYQYAVTYEWVDNHGQRHRSAQSVPITAVVTASSPVTLTVPTLRLTAKQTPVEVCIYRTEDLGDLFYKVTSPSSPLLNVVGTDSVTFEDDLTDASLISRELLYVTGDILENIAAPACSLVISSKNRVWLGGLEDGNELRYSKLFTAGSPVAFNPFLSVNVDPSGGPITALGLLDDKLMVFKRDRIYAVTGDGYNNAGQGQDFVVTLITTDVGCSNPNTVVVTPDGLMFQSEKGIYLIDRSGAAQYVGAGVEAYNDLTFSSATLVADNNQVRFTTETGLALVWDYFFKQWSTFTNYAAVDSENWNGTFALLRRSGRVAVEDTTSFTDGGSHIRLKLVTSWLSMAGLQGFQRVKRLHVLGDYKGPHKLLVKVGYDFNTSFADEKLVDVDSIMNITTYGDDTPYGSGTPYGGAFPSYQFGLHLTKQKCSALRVSLEDNQSSAYNEGLALSSLALEVGVKNGLNKLDTSRRFGLG